MVSVALAWRSERFLCSWLFLGGFAPAFFFSSLAPAFFLGTAHFCGYGPVELAVKFIKLFLLAFEFGVQRAALFFEFIYQCGSFAAAFVELRFCYKHCSLFIGHASAHTVDFGFAHIEFGHGFAKFQSLVMAPSAQFLYVAHPAESLREALGGEQVRNGVQSLALSAHGAQALGIVGLKL